MTAAVYDELIQSMLAIMQRLDLSSTGMNQTENEVPLIKKYLVLEHHLRFKSLKISKCGALRFAKVLSL